MLDFLYYTALAGLIIYTAKLAKEAYDGDELSEGVEKALQWIEQNVDKYTDPKTKERWSGEDVSYNINGLNIDLCYFPDTGGVYVDIDDYSEKIFSYKNKKRVKGIIQLVRRHYYKEKAAYDTQKMKEAIKKIEGE